MDEISIKAILLGVITDIAGSTVAGIIMMPIFGSNLFTEEMTGQELEEALLAMTQGNEFLLTSLIVGIIFTVIGGYVAARVAKKGIYLNSGMVGVIGVFLGILLARDAAPWFDVAGYISVIPAALLGGYLFKSRQKIENA